MRRRSGSVEAGSEDNEAVVFESGDTRISVYPSSFAGTNRATALTWTVDDVDDVVRTLKAKGGGSTLRFAGNEARGRCPHLRRSQGGLVQRPGRQHPQRREWLVGRMA